MLFYNPKTKQLFKKWSPHTESFEPYTDGITEGWLLIVVYTTYDSLGSSHEDSYAILDLYPNLDDAKKNAQHIWDRRAEDFMPDLKSSTSKSILTTEFIDLSTIIKKVEVHWAEAISDKAMYSKIWE